MFSIGSNRRTSYYSSSKNINNLGVKIVKILEEIKELDIYHGRDGNYQNY